MYSTNPGGATSLWDDLNLGNLLDIQTNVVDELTAQYLQQTACPSSAAREKHRKMVEKPTFNVLMGRYQALPHDPVCIDTKVIDRLADPIRGRFAKYDELSSDIHIPEVKYESPTRSLSRSPMRSPESIRKSLVKALTPSNTRVDFHVNDQAKSRDLGGFFLTETGAEGNAARDPDESEYAASPATIQKQEVYARVKEILSPKKPMKQPKPIIQPKYRDPLLNAVRKTMRQKKAPPLEKKKKPAKFTLKGIDSKAQRRGGRMLHATQVKPLPKEKAEALIRSRKNWNDRIVPTELLHSKANLDANTAVRVQNKGANRIGPIRRSQSAGGGKQTKISIRDEDLPPVDPELKVVDQIDDALGIKKRSRQKPGMFPPLATNRNNVDDPGRTEEYDHVLMRSKSSAQLRAERIERVVAARKKAFVGPGSPPIVRAKESGARAGGVRSAPSLLAGLQRVDEPPLHSNSHQVKNKWKSSAPPSGRAPRVIDPIADSSAVRRKLMADVMASDVDGANDSGLTGRQGISSKKSGPPRLAPLGVNNFMPKQTGNSQSANVPSQARNSLAPFRLVDAEDSNGAANANIRESLSPSPSRSNQPSSRGRIDESLSGLEPNTFGVDSDIANDMLADTKSFPRRSVSEVYDSLEKLSKEKSALAAESRKIDPSSKQPLKATKGTAAGTAEIEADVQEKQVEKLMKFTKRFQSQFAAAESLSAEYLTLRNGGIQI